MNFNTDINKKFSAHSKLNSFYKINQILKKLGNDKVESSFLNIKSSPCSSKNLPCYKKLEKTNHNDKVKKLKILIERNKKVNGLDEKSNFNSNSVHKKLDMSSLSNNPSNKQIRLNHNIQNKINNSFNVNYNINTDVDKMLGSKKNKVVRLINTNKPYPSIKNQHQNSVEINVNNLVNIHNVINIQKDQSNLNEISYIEKINERPKFKKININNLNRSELLKPRATSEAKCKNINTDYDELKILKLFENLKDDSLNSSNSIINKTDYFEKTANFSFFQDKSLINEVAGYNS